MALYDALKSNSDYKKRYQAYVLHNPHQKIGDWPGPWWGEVHDTWGFGIDGFLTEADAFKFLEEHFPDVPHGVQEVYWVAEPSKWHEKDKRVYYNREGEA